MDSKFNMLFCLVLGTSGLVEVAEWPMPSRGEWISPVTVTAVAQRQPRYCLVCNGMITVQQILSWREFYVDHIIVRLVLWLFIFNLHGMIFVVCMVSVPT